MELINKDALIAKIEKRKKSCAKQREDMLNLQCYTLADDALTRIGELNWIQDFLNTLVVKEVDLEKEIDDYMAKEWEGIEEDKPFYDMIKNELSDIAKHFFELGIKAA